MENLVTFVFVLGVLLAILLMVANLAMNNVYTVASAEKTVLDRVERGVPVLLREGNGVVVPTDNVLYITREENGVVDIENNGYSDVFWVRLFCWKRNNTDENAVLQGKINGQLQPTSIPVFSSGKTVEYNLADYFNTTDIKNGNVMCALVTRRIIRVFVPHG